MLRAMVSSRSAIISTRVNARSSSDKPERIERDSADAHRFELHFDLPFIDVRHGLGGQRRQELVGPQFNQAALGGAKFLRPESLRTLRSNDQCAAGLQNTKISIGATIPLIV
jgi:hypothetical protein